MKNNCPECGSSMYETENTYCCWECFHTILRNEIEVKPKESGGGNEPRREE